MTAQAPSNGERGGERLVRHNASEAVAAHVRRLIFDGELRQGDKVPQQEIADALGVSRIPVREALVALERDGVVTIEPHRGAFVNAFDSAAVEDHYELYGLIYGHATRRCVERADDAVLDELNALAKEIASETRPGPMLERATGFHALVHRVGGSPRLRAILHSLSGVVPGNFFEAIPGALEIARRAFPEIVAAMKARDAEAAAERCRAMHSAQGERVVAVLEDRGLFGRGDA